MHILLVLHAIRASKEQPKAVLTDCLERISRPGLLGGIQLTRQFCVMHSGELDRTRRDVREVADPQRVRPIALNFRFM
jgi:hypothetical protein